jgi:hypothetical protein
LLYTCLLVGIGDGRIDQMPDAGSLRSVGGKDPLAGFLLHPGLVAVAHQKHRADVICSLQNGCRVTKIANDEVSTLRLQLSRSITIRLTGQRLDAMSSGQQCARNRASLLAGSAGNQNTSFGAHVTAPLVFHWTWPGISPTQQAQPAPLP